MHHYCRKLLSFNSADLREMALFESIDWTGLDQVEMPFVPDPDDAMDTCYFEGKL